MKSGPRFLCVGMPKCGTSTLYDFLSAQDGVFVPPLKEIKFFAYPHLNYRKTFMEIAFSRNWVARQDRLAILRSLWRISRSQGKLIDLLWPARFTFRRPNHAWYSSLFPEDTVSGDISPSSYCLRRHEIAALAEGHPHLKIIILLRSPVEQISSHCKMSLIKNNKNHGAAALEAHVRQLTDFRPSYAGLVEDWRAAFGEMVFVGYLEDMAEQPVGFFEDLLSFLDVQFSRESMAAPPRSHVGVSASIPAEVRPVIAEHPAIRLQGFEAVSQHWAGVWRTELNAFRAGGSTPRTGRVAGFA